MDAVEYEKTPVYAAAHAWAWSLSQTIEFNKLVRDSLTAFVPTLRAAELIARLTGGSTARENLHRHNTTYRAQGEIDDDFKVLNGQILLAAWGGFESFIDDFCRALLTMDRSLLGSNHFKNVKISPSYTLLDDQQQAEAILREAYNKEGSELKAGIGKFQSQLKFVNLDDDVRPLISTELKDRIFYAQQFRNLYAHQAGRADQRFVDNCSALGYSVGQKVDISTARLREWLAALVIYGLLIVNTDRKRRGIKPYYWPIVSNDDALEPPYKAEWGHVHRDTGWWSPPLPIFSKIDLDM